jgi:hypothetical protein
MRSSAKLKKPKGGLSPIGSCAFRCLGRGLIFLGFAAHHSEREAVSWRQTSSEIAILAASSGNGRCSDEMLKQLFDRFETSFCLVGFDIGHLESGFVVDRVG